MQNFDYIFKIVLIGGQGVGKSAIMTRYVDQVFNNTYLSTVGVDFKIKTMQIRNKKIKLQIWDTAGQERFAALTQSHFKGTHGCICVFDVTCQKSLDQAKNYLRVVTDEYAVNPEACFLVANKIDLQNRLISQDEGKQTAIKMGVNYIEASAKDDINITEVFERVALEILKLVEQNKAQVLGPDPQKNTLVHVKTDVVKQKNGCC